MTILGVYLHPEDKLQKQCYGVHDPLASLVLFYTQQTQPSFLDQFLNALPGSDLSDCLILRYELRTL